MKKLLVLLFCIGLLVSCNSSKKDSEVKKDDPKKEESTNLKSPETIYLDGIENAGEPIDARMFGEFALTKTLLMENPEKANKYEYSALTKDGLYYHNDISRNVELVEYDKNTNKEKVVYTHIVEKDINYEQRGKAWIKVENKFTYESNTYYLLLKYDSADYVIIYSLYNENTKEDKVISSVELVIRKDSFVEDGKIYYTENCQTDKTISCIFTLDIKTFKIEELDKNASNLIKIDNKLVYVQRKGSEKDPKVIENAM